MLYYINCLEKSPQERLRVLKVFAVKILWCVSVKTGQKYSPDDSNGFQREMAGISQ